MPYQMSGFPFVLYTDNYQIVMYQIQIHGIIVTYLLQLLPCRYTLWSSITIGWGNLNLLIVQSQQVISISVFILGDFAFRNPQVCLLLIDFFWHIQNISSFSQVLAICNGESMVIILILIDCNASSGGNVYFTPEELADIWSTVYIIRSRDYLYRFIELKVIYPSGIIN